MKDFKFSWKQEDENEKPTGNGFPKKLRAGGRRITLKFAGSCADCGAELPVGTTARWYGRGRIYGLSCHVHAEQGGLDFEKNKPAEAAGVASPNGFAGFSGLLDPEPEPQPEPQPAPAKKYDCTIH